MSLQVLEAFHITDCEKDPRGVYLIESVGGMDDVTECRAQRMEKKGEMRPDGVQMNSLLKAILGFRSGSLALALTLT